MQHKNFIITELRILADRNELYKKVLHPGTFKFNQLSVVDNSEKRLLEREIFGKRIFIQTIVGKNGSGKSSLLEIIYRIINNFSYYILKYTQPKRIAAEPIYLIEQLYADLDFIIDDKKCTILVRDKSLAIIRGAEKLYFGQFIDEFSTFRDYNEEKKDNIIKLASSFFYTIVTNYSFQSLISKDFINDIAQDFVGSKEVGTSPGGNWLDSLFHKNDGYITPIVLNPYRENGKLDLQREYYLTLSRIAALLIQSERSKKELLSGYKLSTIKYKANHGHFIHKLFKKYKASDDSIHLSQVLVALQDERTVANQIIKGYDLTIPVVKDEFNVIPYAYLVYKTLNILGKYAQFEDYKHIPLITQFEHDIDDFDKKALLDAIEEIKMYRSHVNTKIFQTLNYVRSYDSLKPNFTLEQYLPYKNKEKFKDIDDIIEHLPPPFYEQDIRLDKTKNGNVDIPLSSLSSGERQFIYTISTIVYHIKNLLSIQQSNRVRYRNINLVLDEVEICFHPEYQRQFIDRLLDLINRLNLTRNCSFNILIVTHSPFILSDIPKNNILYLEDGKQYIDESLINPFAANINDILYQSFFLEGGFIGEHAKNRINAAVNTLARVANGQKIGKDVLWTEENLKQLIDLIGEPLLRDNLMGLYTEAFGKPSYEEIILAKDEEIQQLKKMLEQRP